MNASSSECSSGCDSGWTLYFQPSSSSSDSSDGYGDADDDNDMLPYGIPGENGKKGGFHDEEEEEDLSMVSDASSGPPVHYEAPCRSTSPKARKDYKRLKMMNKQRGQGRDLRSTLLDDTASSPAVINNHYAWKGGADRILEGRRSAHQEQHHHLGFLHSRNNITATGGHDNQRNMKKKWR
ncbi:hypothetical protein MLD38_013750 [Melastoma candidum]|uniref:Uncharacterized protein n=1 Tax=Melastoma candidum TaxID=119954 RepID=A0ACB9RBQ7_9MYRT|nr:hypothetical protein MLD38_013750 [Melastoma candidum]